MRITKIVSFIRDESPCLHTMSSNRRNRNSDVESGGSSCDCRS